MVFLLLVIIIIIVINFFRQVFSEFTKVNATSLIPLDTTLPEKCAFIITPHAQHMSRVKVIRAGVHIMFVYKKNN